MLYRTSADASQCGQCNGLVPQARAGIVLSTLIALVLAGGGGGSSDPLASSRVLRGDAFSRP